MPRNKSPKRVAKRQPTQNSLRNLIKVEKELLAIPGKIAAQLNKEVNAYKLKETKSAKALSKIRAAVSKAETRSQNAQAKSTPAAKKLFKKFKKTYDAAIKTWAKADKQHQDINSALDVLLQKQTKFIALDKHLSQFEKEWSKNSKNTQNKKSKVKASPAKEHSQERMEVLIDNARVNEPTELAS